MMKVTRFLKDESGATAIEYGLIAAFIAIAMITALPIISTELTDTFDRIAQALVSAP